MNKAELKKQIEELQAQYDAMPDEPVRLFEVAKDEQKYWYVASYLNTSSCIYKNDLCDGNILEVNNHFTDKLEAARMAAFIRKNFLYWRMALRFADGYEWVESRFNGYVYLDSDKYTKADHCYNIKDLGVIYMSKENAKRFAEFCNKHKKELGL